MWGMGASEKLPDLAAIDEGLKAVGVLSGVILVFVRALRQWRERRREKHERVARAVEAVGKELGETRQVLAQGIGECNEEIRAHAKQDTEAIGAVGDRIGLLESRITSFAVEISNRFDDHAQRIRDLERNHREEGRSGPPSHGKTSRA